VRVDVLLGVAPAAVADVAGRVVAVIDVLRASTTVAVALANGARAVIPFQSAEEVVLRSKSFERSEVRLAAEHKMLTVQGCDLGNSPAEFTREAIEGKTILLATTNGTAALLDVQSARDVVVASYVNYSAVAARLVTALRDGSDIALVCAGRERQFSLEDAACAGRYVRAIAAELPSTPCNDAAQACAVLEGRYGDDLSALFTDAAHGRALIEAGFARDLDVCGSIDAYPVVPVYQDRQITKLAPVPDP
jgi:2-phosphosulfolactate phosphatase